MMKSTKILINASKACNAALLGYQPSGNDFDGGAISRSFAKMKENQAFPWSNIFSNRTYLHKYIYLRFCGRKYVMVKKQEDESEIGLCGESIQQKIYNPQLYSYI